MIIGERKPLEEIFDRIAPFKKIYVLGCETCIAVCLAGGNKEAQETAAAISLYRKEQNQSLEIKAGSIQRQCEYEFVEEIADEIKDYELVLSMACGVGVQTIAEKYPEKFVLPGVNTKFLGLPTEQGVWMENCQACGDCFLDISYGICPITRCSKSMLNGPCGGSSEGVCELSTKDVEIQCGWHLIYERLKNLGKLEKMHEYRGPKDWRASFHGGARKLVKEDVKIVRGE